MNQLNQVAERASADVNVEFRTVGDQELLHMNLIHDPGAHEIRPEMSCIYCGCTESNACPGGCAWVVPYVCSSCTDQFYGFELILKSCLGKVSDEWYFDEALEEIGNFARDWKTDVALELRGKSLWFWSIKVVKSMTEFEEIRRVEKNKRLESIFRELLTPAAFAKAQELPEEV